MPASQKTPNYQLPIYAEEDVTSYLQDFNPAMQKIDAQMKANADAAAAAQSDADSLDTRVTALEEAPAGVTELDSDTDVTGFENGYILVNNNGKLGAIEPSGGTGTDPNAIHASGGGTFSASEGIGSTGPYNIVVDEEPAGVPITSDDVTVPESASAFAGQTVTEALESLHEGESSGAAAENVSYDNAASGLAATNVQDAIDEVSQAISGSPKLHHIKSVKTNDSNAWFFCGSPFYVDSDGILHGVVIVAFNVSSAPSSGDKITFEFSDNLTAKITRLDIYCVGSGSSMVVSHGLNITNGAYKITVNDDKTTADNPVFFSFN